MCRLPPALRSGMYGKGDSTTVGAWPCCKGVCKHKSSVTLRHLLPRILAGKGVGTLLCLGNHLSPSLGTAFGSPPLLENCLTPRVCVHAAHAEQGGGGKRRPQSECRSERKNKQTNKPIIFFLIGAVRKTPGGELISAVT